MKTSTPFRDLLHAANLRHGTDGFTSPPKEGVLRIFSPLKVRRLRPGLNPRTWVLKASTLPLDHRSRLNAPLWRGYNSKDPQAIVGRVWKLRLLKRMAGLTTAVSLPIGCRDREVPCDRLSYWYVKYSEWYSCQRKKLAFLLQQEWRCRTDAKADLELRCSGMRHCTIPLHLTSGSGFATGIEYVWGMFATPPQSFIARCLCTGTHFILWHFILIKGRTRLVIM